MFTVSEALPLRVFCAEKKEAPEGFYWQKVKKLNCTLPVPYGWFLSQEEVDGVIAVFVSRENIAELGKLETGLTVNVYRKLRDISAEAYALRFMKNLENPAIRNVTEKWETVRGPLRIYGCCYNTDGITDEKAITTQVVTMANTATNTLYIMWFESPSEKWEETWKTGQVLLGRITVDESM